MRIRREIDDRVIDPPGMADIKDQAQRAASQQAQVIGIGKAPRPIVSKPKARLASPIAVSKKPAGRTAAPSPRACSRRTD